jgi:hypothetical protein
MITTENQFFKTKSEHVEIGNYSFKITHYCSLIKQQQLFSIGNQRITVSGKFKSFKILSRRKGSISFRSQRIKCKDLSYVKDMFCFIGNKFLREKIFYYPENERYIPRRFVGLN